MILAFSLSLHTSEKRQPKGLNRITMMTVTFKYLQLTQRSQEHGWRYTSRPCRHSLWDDEEPTTQRIDPFKFDPYSANCPARHGLGHQGTGSLTADLVSVLGLSMALAYKPVRRDLYEYLLPASVRQ